MGNSRRKLLKFLLIAIALASIWGEKAFCAKPLVCPPIYLKTDDGLIINPMTGENADQPYSTRQTCGSCHDYDKITQGYHFQMGWNEIAKPYKKDQPWALSPGMAGGF